MMTSNSIINNESEFGNHRAIWFVNDKNRETTI